MNDNGVAIQVQMASEYKPIDRGILELVGFKAVHQAQFFRALLSAAFY